MLLAHLSFLQDHLLLRRVTPPHFCHPPPKYSKTHRLRFRKDRREAEETYREWSHRLQEHFVRWRKDQDIPLEELVLIEQFMAGVPQDLAVWLRERRPKSPQEAAEQADDYVAARKAEGRSEGNQSELQRMSKGSQLSDPRPSADTGGRMQPPPATIAPERSKTNSKGEKQCFRCHGWGHVSYNCPKVQEAQVPTAQPKALYRVAAKTMCEMAVWMGTQSRC